MSGTGGASTINTTDCRILADFMPNLSPDEEFSERWELSQEKFAGDGGNGKDLTLLTMTRLEREGSALNTPFNTFATSFLQLYSGPQVEIRIGSASRKYKLPKALLCMQAPYFAAMFQEEGFLEGAELSTTLEEIDGVVSTRSFEMLVQWVYLNRIVFSDSPLAELIAALIEFARLADMVSLTGVEPMIAEHIRQVILANRPVEDSVFATPPDEHTYHLKLEHIRSGVLLPKGHLVRKMLALAAVKGYLLSNCGKNFKETQELPDFAVDVLREVGVALESLESEKGGMTFKDTFSGQRINLNGVK